MPLRTSFFQKYEHKTDVDKVLLTAFQRVGVNLQSIDGEHLSWYIPSCVTNHMKSFVRRMKLPKDHLLNGAMIMKYDELKTHDTHVFVFCFLPVLLHPYQHYQAVQQLTLMIVLQWIYNSRRITPDVLSLSMQLDFHMNGLESVSSPSVGNPSYHYSHMHTVRMVFGPLWPNDYYPEEAIFFPESNWCLQPLTLHFLFSTRQ